MKKAVFAIFMAAIMLFSGISVMADETLERARVLYDLGLLRGTGGYFSPESLELTRNATRAEACTTIVRMLGKEEKANYQQNQHPFGDVPDWASNYIGWLYENYLVNGVSDTYFGAQDITTVQQFCTMLLRVLGYEEGGVYWDFTYDNAVSYAQGIGLIDGEIASHWELSRKDMINMCYTALRQNIRNSSRSLIAKLCDEKAVDYATAVNSGILAEPSIEDAFADVPNTLGEISVSEEWGRYVITFDEAQEEFGLRVYVKESGGALRAVSLEHSGDPIRMQKGHISYPGTAAGYVSELYVYGLENGKKYSFIVIKTTSEDALYNVTGRSGGAHN